MNKRSKNHLWGTLLGTIAFASVYTFSSTVLADISITPALTGHLWISDSQPGQSPAIYEFTADGGLVIYSYTGASPLDAADHLSGSWAPAETELTVSSFTGTYYTDGYAVELCSVDAAGEETINAEAELYVNGLFDTEDSVLSAIAAQYDGQYLLYGTYSSNGAPFYLWAVEPAVEGGSTDIAADLSMPEGSTTVSSYADIYSYAVSRSQQDLTFLSSDVTEYPKVKAYFSLENASGDPVILTDPIVGIREAVGGTVLSERNVLSIERLEGNQGLSIDIVADKSGSMDYDLPEMQMIMQQFVSSLDYASGDRAEIISFDSYIMYMCTYTNNAALLQNGISNMTAEGGTALYDALITGINNAGSQAGARCVIGFTDGDDNESVSGPDLVIQQAQLMEVPVYIIGTSGASHSVLSNICAQTGGQYWSIDSISNMAEVMKQIYRQQKDTYCVTYESDSAADPYNTRLVSAVLTDDTNAGIIENWTFTPTKAIEQIPHSSRYMLVAGDVSWTEANNAAIAAGGHLITITSQAEQDAAVQLAESAGLKYIWIGGYTSIRNNSVFGHWITGENFGYTAWYPGEPSRDDTDGTPEFYLMLWKVNDAWSWNDQRENVFDSGLTYFQGAVGYIIEFEDTDAIEEVAAA